MDMYLRHVLARNGPGYFFKGEVKYEARVHNDNVLAGTTKSKNTEGDTRLKILLAGSRIEVSYKVCLDMSKRNSLGMCVRDGMCVFCDC